jgi:hypothetical protein
VFFTDKSIIEKTLVKNTNVGGGAIVRFAQHNKGNQLAPYVEQTGGLLNRRTQAQLVALCFAERAFLFLCKMKSSLFYVKLSLFHVKSSLFYMKSSLFHVKSSLFYMKSSLFHVKSSLFQRILPQERLFLGMELKNEVLGANRQGALLNIYRDGA